MLCDVAVMLIVIVCDWRSAQTGHCAGMAKVCLTGLISWLAWDFVSCGPWKPRRHCGVRGWGGTGRYQSSDITLHPFIIHWDRRARGPLGRDARWKGREYACVGTGVSIWIYSPLNCVTCWHPAHLPSDIWKYPAESRQKMRSDTKLFSKCRVVAARCLSGLILQAHYLLLFLFWQLGNSGIFFLWII